MLFLPAIAVAQSPPRVESESRDAATAYILTQNFVIGRTARDCFETMERTDTPKEFVQGWQKRNAKFYAAAITYMKQRLTEAGNLGGNSAKDRVVAELTAAIDRDGRGAVSDFFKNGDKHDVCVRVIGLMAAGAFDIDARSPMYSELQGLVRFIEGS